MSLWKLPLRLIEAPESKMDERVSPMMSLLTSSSSVKPMMPLSGPSAASLMAAQISSSVAAFSVRTVRSTTLASGVGTRNAMPVSLPSTAGITLPTALAAPVDAGMIDCMAPRPERQLLALGASTVFCVAVVACTVVMRPSTMPNLSLITLTSGARQLVVHDAFEITSIDAASYLSSFTPMTNIGASFDGALMITFLAPPLRCALAFSMTVKMPVDSITTSAPTSPHLMSSGLRSANTVMALPFTTSLPSFASTVPANLPCVESCFTRYTR
mmetsp:Transcript_53638/g.131438  ORF Transcript_53638/g.131438 Transcript_53638/m.131438 type:complete len:271 (+) Transcript_53638:149-961(+)